MSQSHPLPTYIFLKTLATIVRTIYKLLLAASPSKLASKLSIPSREPNRNIKAYVFIPPGTKKGPSPVLLNWHGSGFLIDAHGSDKLFCEHIAAEAGLLVLDADYRKAPEHPFPAALEDVEDAIRFVLGRPEEYDADRIYLSGFSAGANLALAVCGVPLHSSGKGKETIGSKVKGVVAFYPPTDLATPSSKKRAPDGSAGTIPVPVSTLFRRSYIPSGVSAINPRISIKFMKPEDFVDRALIVTCGKDDLAFEAEELAARMAERSGNNGGVLWRRVEGVDHGWNLSVKTGSDEERKRDEAYRWSVEFLKGN